MTAWHLISVTNIVCAAIGAFVGSRTGRLPGGLFAGIIGGPFGLVFFLLRRPKRRISLTDPLLASPVNAIGGPAVTGSEPSGTTLALPIQVLVGGAWTDGILNNWRQGPTQWEGSVTYPLGAGSATGWFPPELLRRSEGAAAES
ncbi:MAG: hypothetical protein ACRDPI_09030 [Nocardioidaceae bacterium]